MTAIFTGFAAILIGHKAVGKGIVLGALFSVINFVLMARSLPSQLEKTRRQAFFRSMSSIFFRYCLLAIPVVVAVKYERINLIATVVGIFLVQLVIVVDQIKHLFAPKDG